MILIPHWRQRRTHVIVELDIVVIVVVLKGNPKGTISPWIISHCFYVLVNGCWVAQKVFAGTIWGLITSSYILSRILQWLVLDWLYFDATICDTVFEYHGIALNIIPVDKKELYTHALAISLCFRPSLDARYSIDTNITTWIHVTSKTRNLCCKLKKMMNES